MRDFHSKTLLVTQMKFDPLIRNRIRTWFEAGVKKSEILRRVNVELRRDDARTKITRKRIQRVIDNLYKKPKEYCMRGLARQKWEEVTSSLKAFYEKNKKASRRMAMNHLKATFSVKVYCIFGSKSI